MAPRNRLWTNTSILVIYALQDAEAVACMRRPLKRTLQQDHVAGQEVVLIEQVPVQFVEAEKE